MKPSTVAVTTARLVTDGLAGVRRSGAWGPLLAGVLAAAACWPPATPDLAVLHGWHPSPGVERPPVVQIVQPMIDAAAGRTRLWSDRIAGVVAGLPLWTPPRARDSVSALAGGMAVMCMAVVARWTAGATVPAVAAALALAFSPSFWDRTAGASGHPLAGVLLGATVLGLAAWTTTRRAWQLWVVGVAACLAVEAWPPVALLLPGLGLWVASVTRGVSSLLAALGPMVLLGSVGLAHHAIAIRTLAADWTMAGAPDLRLEPLRGMAAWHGLLASGDGLPFIQQLGDLVGSVWGELGPLGLICFAAGVVHLAPRRHPLLMCCAGAAVTVVGWLWLTGAERVEEAMLPALWIAYPVVAAGVAWLIGDAAIRRPRIWALGLALTLSLAGFFANITAMRRARHHRAFVIDRVERLADRLPADAVVMAESPLLDRAIESVRERRAGTVRRIPRASLAAALAGTAPVFGFDGAAGRVRGLGAEASALPDQRLALTLSAYLDSWPRGFIVVAAAAPGFQQVAGPAVGATFGAAGGREALYGVGFASYAFVGVVGADAPVVERLGAKEAVAVVPLGGPLDRSGSWAPVAVRAVSEERGARVVVNRNTVAEVVTGLALAVVSPQGRIRATHELELGGPSTMAPSVTEPVLYRLRALPRTDGSS